MKNEHDNLNYLDINLNITNKNQPFHKINENLKYINSLSNHPKSVKVTLIQNTGKWISMLSSDYGIFIKHTRYCNKALKEE